MSDATGTKAAGNLPAELTSFVGRRREVTDIKRLLGASRLVTLVGVGGVGKTRLALHVAGGLRRAFVGGGWLVDLAAIRDAELLAQTVGAALGLQDQSRLSPSAALFNHIADRQLLIILDNCEHLLDGCAVLADGLLRAGQEVRLLATSRQSLRIDGEQVFPVMPLLAPGSEVLSPSPDVLTRYDAVNLFVQRARASSPDFEVTTANAPAVHELCRRLDGLPLALELAAARIRVLSPEQLVSRLDDPYRLLAAGNRAASPRQRSLQELVGWSFELCSFEERLLWSRLSVFHGGFDVEAAEEVCSGDGIDRQEVLELLAGLVDKSIVVAEAWRGRVRYRMLETIRGYGEERLVASGEHDVVRRRHRDYLLRLAHRSWDEWFGPRQRVWMDRWRDEHANLRAAVEYSLSQPGEEQAALGLAIAFVSYANMSGVLGEGRHWLDRALAAAPEPTAGRARASWIDGWLALSQGDVVRAEAMLSQGRDLARQLGDLASAGQATAMLGTAAAMRGDLAGAAELCEEALALCRAADDSFGTALAAARLATVSHLSGDAHRAVLLFEDALAISEREGEWWCRAHASYELGVVLWRQGALPRATDLVQDSLRVRWSFEHLGGTAHCFEALAWIAASEGEHERAGRLLGAASSVWRAIDALLIDYFAVHHAVCVTDVRQAIGERRYAAALRAGADLELDHAVAYALGEPAASRDVSTPAAPTALTKREREIAELISEGLSNRDIATRLVIAQRTAEGHVERILAKLGFSSRAQVAAWVAENRSRTP